MSLPRVRPILASSSKVRIMAVMSASTGEPAVERFESLAHGGAGEGTLRQRPGGRAHGLITGPLGAQRVDAFGEADGIGAGDDAGARLRDGGRDRDLLRDDAR